MQSVRSVTSREYKVMLRRNRFTGDEAQLLSVAGEFHRDLKKAVKGIEINTHGDLARIKNRRSIRFYDTAAHHLIAGQYIFRERRDAATDEREVTLKFRHPDRHIAQDRDMDAAPDGGDGDGNARTKFEEDIKVPFASLYSFSTTLRIARDKKLNKLSDVARMFPDIVNRLNGFSEGKRLLVVNGFTAKELVIVGAGLQFAKTPDMDAECGLIVWYDQARSDKKPVAVEFSFRYGDKNENYRGEVVRCAFEAFGALQVALNKWVDPKKGTKTAHVYG
jgi:hypothetical protein